MKYLSTLLLLVICITARAQTDSTTSGNIDTVKEFKTVQIEAKFPGGVKSWTRYLENNLNANLGARYLKPKKGETITQTAIISFLVDKEGKISEVEILNPEEVHPKLVAESIRVIKEGPAWTPAVQHGKNVVYRQKQSVTWQVVRE